MHKHMRAGLAAAVPVGDIMRWLMYHNSYGDVDRARPCLPGFHLKYGKGSPPLTTPGRVPLPPEAADRTTNEKGRIPAGLILCVRPECEGPAFVFEKITRGLPRFLAGNRA